MTRHPSQSARSAALRYAVLASATILATTSLAALSGQASASTTPTAGPSTSAELVAPTPSVSADPATSSPDPASLGSTPTPADTPTTVSPTPTTPIAPAPSAPTASTPSTSLAPIDGTVLPGARTPVRAAANGSFDNPHGPYDMRADGCAGCHRAHTANSRVLLAADGPQSSLCFTCHDGTGALSNVKSAYTNPLVPANDPATASYYSHDSLAADTHTFAQTDEFAGVTNRHAQCGDCHDPHAARGTASTSVPISSPWTPSGRIAGITGVSATNGVGGSTPTYTWLNGTTTPLTAEYQLCLKCHSGYTKLLTNPSGKPSRDKLDVGVEFNPANNSFHPVEAPGRNTTPKMALSLSGTSPWKLWNFTVGSTVRCTNCHAAGTAYAGAPNAGADLAPHTSQYRGILIQKYEDRVLKSSSSAYNGADFALCFLCHTDTPFNNSGSSAATNFTLHRLHVAGISGEGGGGTDIDTPGDGQGNALCAECHFRPHSTATTPEQNNRLVAFSPNVEPFGGQRTWTSGGVGKGSCTLTCHGMEHSRESYG